MMRDTASTAATVAACAIVQACVLACGATAAWAWLGWPGVLAFAWFEMSVMPLARDAVRRGRA